MLETYVEIIKKKLKYLAIRLIAGIIVGIICGALGYLFHILVDKVTEFRMENFYVIYFIPLAGLFIVLMCKILKTEGLDTSSVMESAVYSRPVKIALLPSVFIGTVLTHLVGGSSGREGAALQMGSSIGSFIGKILRLDRNHCRIAMLSGMAAFFTALFGTPIAATLFVMMGTYVGITVYEVYLPVFVSSISAYFVAILLGVKPTRFLIKAPKMDIKNVLLIMALAVLCGIVAIIFYKLIHFIEHKFHKISNAYIRVLVGSVILILAFSIFRDMRYCGAGMNIIGEAIRDGKALPYDFILKIILTAITLGCGFKGGEVVPSFYVGATFGCVVAPLLGINPGFGAAIGLVSVFCAATNTLIPSIFLGIEMFGGKGIIFFAIACTISYFVSGRDSLYSCQKVLHERDLFNLFELSE